MRKHIGILLLFMCASLHAQEHLISGRVVDDHTGEPLPFVNIVINESKTGGTTDIDGKFNLSAPAEIKLLTFSYVGYEKKVINPDDTHPPLKVRLKRMPVALPEYTVFPEKNPAHRIIVNAVRSKSLNDPEKMEAFSYTSYDKMIFTIDTDSLLTHETLDSLPEDSAGLRAFLRDQHFFLMETVSERKFKAPDRNFERVLANRVSGFKDPVFVFLLSQMQKASFYDDIITISDKNYVNPVSRGSTRKYFFLLEDTLYSAAGDSIFIISFRPKKGANFDGLKGVVSIHSGQWAIKNVRAEPARRESGFGLRFEQMYEWVNNTHWFPVQLNTELIFNNLMVTDSTIQLGMGEFRGPDVRVGIGKSYIRDIDFDPEFNRGEFGHIEVDVEPDAHARKEEFWDRYRVDSLDRKELNTYRVIDSIGKEANFDRMAQTVRSLTTGKIPWGNVELDIRRFITYNDYEGFAPGLGMHTSDRLSGRFKVGGYFRYGFRDKDFKYGGDLSVFPVKYRDLEVGVSYLNDVEETGGVRFFNESYSLLNPASFRRFLVQRMDRVEEWNAFLRFRTIHYLTIYTGLSAKRKEITSGYRYAHRSEDVNVYMQSYDIPSFTLGVRFAYKEQFIRNNNVKISLGTGYPILLFQYTRGIKGFLDGDFEFNRYDAQLDKSFLLKYLGKSTFRIAGGYIDSDIPAPDLYHVPASYRPFTVYAPVSFATMRMNEFIADRYIALYYTHNFRKLLIRTGKFDPEPAIAFNAGFGWLDDRESHTGTDYQVMDKGFFETGVMINNLLDLEFYTLGLGAFYRFGGYSLGSFGKNIAGKLTITFPY